MRNIVWLAGIMLLQYSFAQNFVTREGNKLKYQGDEILLRGMSFGNLVWVDSESPTDHHSEIDYERVADLGMNVIRFYMNYKTFEADNAPYVYLQSGWDWIDQNVQWAKNHGIFLILNMHVPQGGFQSQCAGSDLWEVPENQNRLAALWKAIADRYQDEPQIAGYDIVNEPTPSTSIQDWSNLAQGIIDSIRAVDQNHLIITERAIALDCDYGYNDGNYNYPDIEEENLMYTVHMYEPYAFTHQNLDWAGTGDGGSYPDEDEFTLPSDLEYETGDYDNTSISTGTTDWTYIQGSPYTASNTDILVGRVIFSANGLDAGIAYFDDFVVEELDADNNVIRTIFDEPLTDGSYWWWSENADGNYAASTDGHGDNYALTVSGNSGAATVIAHEYTFKVVQGNKYRISGWLKGENLPTGARATISTEYYSSPSGAELKVRNYDYLYEQITSYTKYIEDNNFPVYFGEFGVARTGFVDDKGGERWVADVMDIFDELGYHFTYHSYKESSFGYYDGWNQPVDPSTVNVKLEDAFRNFFDSYPTAVEGELENSQMLSLYPNPATSKVYLKGRGKHQWELYNSLGELIEDGEGNEINTLNLPSGIYIVRAGDQVLRLVKH